MIKYIIYLDYDYDQQNKNFELFQNNRNMFICCHTKIFLIKEKKFS